MEVPCRGSEGRVIGKGGEMIKYIQNATGAKLDMKRDVGTVLVSGTPDAVAKAQGLVLEVIENGDTRDKGGLVPGAYAAAGMGAGAADAAPGMMTGGVAPGGMAPVMVAVPMGAPPGAYYAPHAAAGAYQLQQYNVPAAAYGAQTQAAHAYDPNAAQAAAAAEWGQAPQAQAPQQTAPQQTGEWQTHYSEGRAYYYNVATGETRWA
jgi:far upstream element-binding protein